MTRKRGRKSINIYTAPFRTPLRSLHCVTNPCDMKTLIRRKEDGGVFT